VPSKEVINLKNNSPFENIDRFPATARPNKKHNYMVNSVATYITFQHQLIMLGRAHTWMHYDDQNAVNEAIMLGEDLDLSILKSPNRTKYFKNNY